jgi:hypothetical protein
LAGSYWLNPFSDGLDKMISGMTLAPRFVAAAFELDVFEMGYEMAQEIARRSQYYVSAS